jgi:hypothetical protein
VAQWQIDQRPPGRTGTNVPLEPNGEIMETKVQALLSTRDNRSVTIKE